MSRALADLAARSRALAVDRSLVNVFGGNTSAKATELDHMGRETRVLWVKGSGSDMAEITERGFAGLRLDELLPLRSRDRMSDEEMVAYLDRTVFEPGRPRQSIETLLHAFVPSAHVDHTHPDAILSIACAPKGEEIAREIWGERMIWIPYIRPGFELSRQIGEAVTANPNAVAVLMAKHGLVTWAETSDGCHARTLSVVAEAQAYLDARTVSAPFGAEEVPPLDELCRRAALLALLPVLRGAMARVGRDPRRSILALDLSDEARAFSSGSRSRELAAAGAACPDHLVHTKRLPLFLDPLAADLAEWAKKAGEAVERYAERYAAEFERHRGEDERMADPSPRVVVVPGIGVIGSGPDAEGAQTALALYRRAVAVMRGAKAVGGFETLSPEEAHAIEYWPLELYKLSLKPAPRPLAGTVAVVTGAASGIGRAIARRFAAEGAHIVVLDRNRSGSDETVAELPPGRGLAVAADVTDEGAIEAAFDEAVLRFGGVDVAVNNAGIASSAAIEDTTLEEWDRNHAILSTGYFLVARAAFRRLRAQGSGGSLVFVCSKNSIAAGRNAAAYSAAKAAELHLARCLAEEGGAAGIRVNSVLPDGVLAGSSIWSGRWREERAATYGVAPHELEAFYRARTTLKVNVLPEDIAEAAFFLVSPAASKTTGGVLTVDGGNPIAYVR